MPSIEQAERNQWAVFWNLIGVDSYGEEQFSRPVALKVRWIHSRSKVTDKQGNTTQLDAQVVTNQNLKLRSVIWLSSSKNGDDALAEYKNYQLSTPSGRELMRVESLTDRTPDLKGRNIRWNFAMKAYKDVTMPIGTSAYAGANDQFAGSSQDYAGAT